MSTKSEILEVLNKNTNTYISGQQLADMLSLSRNSVWKAIKKLQEQGYEIESKPSIGYRLMKSEDIITADGVKDGLTQHCKVQVYDVLDSTNRVARELPSCEIPHIIIANEQTKGRGRLGRSFYSPANAGLYMTLAFKPTFGLDRAMLTTTFAAVAVCNAIEKTMGLYPKIKWVNDLYMNGKKVCGIMTEAQTSVETGNIDRIILGIGVNCFETQLPEDLEDIAVSLGTPKMEYTRNQLAAAIVNEFFALLDEPDTKKVLRQYKSRSFILGEQIMIYNTITGQSPDKNSKGIRARAIDIDDNGGLVVEYLEGRRMREMDTLTTGEISIRKVD